MDALNSYRVPGVGHIYRRGVPYKYPSIDSDVSVVDRVGVQKTISS